MSQAETSSAAAPDVDLPAAAGEPQDGDRLEGEVKWFDVKKGFGFIGGPEGQDVFVHFSAITGDGFRTLKDGEGVSYTLSQGDKGFHALDVRRISPPQPSMNDGPADPDRPARKSFGRDKPAGAAKHGGPKPGAGNKPVHANKSDRRDKPRGPAKPDRAPRRPSIEALPHERDRSLVGAPPASSKVGNSRADHGLPVDDDDDGYVG